MRFNPHVLSLLSVSAILALLLSRAWAAEAADAPGDWPCWRGPTLDNHAPRQPAPSLRWSDTDRVIWRVTLPGTGHGSPCIVGEQVFVPAADKARETIWLICLERTTGKERWRTAVHNGPFPKIHDDNSPASATPACDGARVYYPYQTTQSVCMAAVRLDGTLAWNRPVAPFASVQGFSASPALHKSLVVVSVDGSHGQRLFGIHGQTGKEIWQAPLPKSRENYASPLVARVAGRHQAIVVGGIRTASFDADTGAPLWSCHGPAEFCAATVAFNRDTVYATGGYPEKALMAIRADGQGDVTATHVTWTSDKKAGYVPSPLLHGDRIWAVSDKGLMRCYAAGDGEVLWEHNFKTPFYSSPVWVGGRIYVFDRKGNGYVIAAAREFELLAANTLPQGMFATPVILGGRIYLRTLGDFYCIGASHQD